MAGYGEANYAESGYGEQVSSNPSGTFAAVLPVVTAAFAGAYHPHEAGTFSATLPAPLTASFSGTYTPPVNPTGDFGATLPHPLTASFSGTYTPGLETGSFVAVLPHPLTTTFAGTYTPFGDQGTFAAVLPVVTAALVGLYHGPIPTDTSNALDGLDITFTGTATAVRPPTPVPAHLVLAEKYDKAIAYPPPVMDNGRPT